MGLVKVLICFFCGHPTFSIVLFPTHYRAGLNSVGLIFFFRYQRHFHFEFALFIIYLFLSFVFYAVFCFQFPVLFPIYSSPIFKIINILNFSSYILFLKGIKITLSALLYLAYRTILFFLRCSLLWRWFSYYKLQRTNARTIGPRLICTYVKSSTHSQFFIWWKPFPYCPIFDKTQSDPAI